MLTAPIVGIHLPPIRNTNEDMKADVCCSKDVEIPLSSCRSRQKPLNMQPPPYETPARATGCNCIIALHYYRVLSVPKLYYKRLLSPTEGRWVALAPLEMLNGTEKSAPGSGSDTLNHYGGALQPRRNEPSQACLFSHQHLPGRGAVLVITAPD